LSCFSGGRGVVVGPILNQAKSDVFCDNENGPNFLFKNKGDGTFVDMARQAGGKKTGEDKIISDWSRTNCVSIFCSNLMSFKVLVLSVFNSHLKVTLKTFLALPTFVKWNTTVAKLNINLFICLHHIPAAAGHIVLVP